MSLTSYIGFDTPAGAENKATLKRRLRSDLRGAGIAMALFFLVGGGWAYLTQISGAVIAQGTVSVAADLQHVQYLEGGIVDEILVEDGDHVNAGQLLVKMDTTALQAQFDIAENHVVESYLLMERLEAELAGESTLEVPPELVQLVGEIDFSSALRSQNHLLETRLTALENQRSLYARQIDASRSNAESLRMLVESLESQLALVRDELNVLEPLLEKELVAETRVINVRRSFAELSGQIGRNKAQLAAAESQVVSAALQLAQVDDRYRAEVLETMQDTRAELSNLIKQYETQRNALLRAEVRAPRNGVVYQSAVNTPGQVVAAGAEMMMIVPSDDELIFEVQIRPSEIDQVHVNQPAKIRIGAYNARLLQDMEAKVTFVSPDIVTDSTGRVSYYLAHLSLQPGEVEKLGEIALVPGMPINAFIQKENRRVLSFLLQPLLERLEETFRE